MTITGASKSSQCCNNQGTAELKPIKAQTPTGTFPKPPPPIPRIIPTATSSAVVRQEAPGARLPVEVPKPDAQLVGLPAP
jgi:hypothetical protein